jgi:hypothetical protein
MLILGQKIELVVIYFFKYILFSTFDSNYSHMYISEFKNIYDPTKCIHIHKKYMFVLIVYTFMIVP